mmetsp:Transcript_1615/g.1430  ORF Transcript_1615/g.1430 Transcript_1615/m.1430 type:complete len:225 (+) Transcript_1615:1-675(+)
MEYQNLNNVFYERSTINVCAPTYEPLMMSPVLMNAYNQTAKLLDLVEKYCVCYLNDTKNNTDIQEEREFSSTFKGLTEVISSEEDDNKPALQRKRKIPIPDITKKLRQVYRQVQRNSEVVIKCRNKGTRGLHNGLSSRRSQYVGVSKNGVHWQTLINFGKTKKYIGTYCTEEEAALTYDFYCFGIRGLKAKTNFKHKGKLIMDMIDHFINSDGSFDPSQFVSQL